MLAIVAMTKVPEPPVLEPVVEEKVWLATVDDGEDTGGELEFEVFG